MSRRWTMFAGMLTLIGLSGPASALDDDPKAKVFVGYLYGAPRNINYRLYTHLCHAFVVADADGKLRENRQVPSKDLAAEAHAAGVKVLISLGGWGWDAQFAAIVADTAAEDRYVAAVLRLVDEADYDGLDLDWEYPDTKEEIVGFERLTRRLRKGLDEIATKSGRPMLLTMAASSNPGTLRWLDRDFLLETMDWINVMTYDYTGDWIPYAGHNAPLFASTKTPDGSRRSLAGTMAYLTEDRKIPADRLAVGLPLYGRGAAVAEPYDSKKDRPQVRLPGDYRSIKPLLDEQGWTRRWDDEIKAPWLLDPDRSKVIAYDDPESIGLKTDWAMSHGFRGVFFWQIAGDRLPDGSNPLQDAARKRLDSR